MISWAKTINHIYINVIIINNHNQNHKPYMNAIYIHMNMNMPRRKYEKYWYLSEYKS